MDIIKGKYTIVCKWLNGKIEIFNTDKYWLVENDTSYQFLDLNNVEFDKVTGKQRPTTLPKILCKVEGGDVQ